MRKTMSFLAGVICGALVGAAAGILLAPLGGPELQQRIKEWAQSVVEKGQQAAMARRTELEAQLEAFKQGRPLVLQEADQISGDEIIA